MAVSFKTKPTLSNPYSNKSLSSLQEQVRAALGLSLSAEINIGMSRSTIRQGGVEIGLPFGIPHVKKGSQKLQEARTTLNSMVPGMTTPSDLPAYDAASEAAGGVPIPAKPGTLSQHQTPVVADADMDDQLWVEHVANQLFPGTLHLYQAEELYQPVLGTSGGSIYKTCFIGPELRVAARIKGNKVSFRATTNTDTCPSDPVKTVFKRLGVTQEHSNRLTCHSSMNGKFDNEHAHEYRALFGAFYAALKPWITSNYPAIGLLAQGVK